MSVQRMETVCAAQVLYQFAVPHMLIDLWQTEKEVFPDGATGHDICIFVKGYLQVTYI